MTSSATDHDMANALYVAGLPPCYWPKCENGGICDDNDGANRYDYTCDCTNTGFEGHNCTDDFDECAAGTDTCDVSVSNCTNTVGSFNCTCITGYEGTGDGRTCTDIDECSTGTDSCDSSISLCSNNVGSYTCTCGSGYVDSGNGITCDDVDECDAGTDTCDVSISTCANTVGSFTCTCVAGYEDAGDGKNCIDIDECTAGTDSCDDSISTCLNNEGSYTCTCNGGYEDSGDGITCDDIDECAAGTDTCDPVAESCENNVGSFECGCAAGFEGSIGNCIDIDECSTGAHDCNTTVATCVNIDGSYNCDCGSGYDGDGTTNGTGCSDADECSDGTDTCDPSISTCVNTIGSFNCTCDAGYEDPGDGQTCNDIDECTLGTDNCHSSLGTCTNIGGSFTCACNTGYDGDGTADGTGCSDIDECSEDTDGCNVFKSTCSNNVGSYTCVCKSGFEDAGNGITCLDINECSVGTHDCLSTTGACTNLLGTFSCACKAGYDGDGVTSCTDIDECTEGTDDCHATLATCNNTIGSHTCTCLEGYSGDGTECSDVDECTEGTHNCLEDATCLDKVGGFSCFCNDGFEGDGSTYCTDINECAMGLANCHPAYATCTNMAPYFSCDCINGYAGNGYSCFEIDECIGQNCNNRGSCVDLVAEFRCDCDYSYWGDVCQYDSEYLNTVPLVESALYWSFDVFNTSGDGKFANQDINGTQFNADPGLAVMHSYAVSGNSTRTRQNGTEDCLSFGDFSGLCVSDPNTCDKGLSVSLWIRLTLDEIKEPGPVYILSSGPPDSVGFSVYRSPKKLGFTVADGTKQWIVELNDMIPANLWKNIGFSWNSTQGLKVMIDTEVVGTNPTGIDSATAPIVGLLTLGCRHNGGDFTGHSTGLFDELVIWPTYFNSSYEYDWMMGGWDYDDCVIEPCADGDCFDEGMAAYRCECHPGYNGTLCEIEIDECESNPCQNGGTCSDHVALYMCECAFGFTGHSCESDLTPNYDYSQAVVVLPIMLISNPGIHPYYRLAPIYWPLNDIQELDAYGVNLTAVAGRGGLGLYPMLGGSDTWINMGDFAGECLGSPIKCTTGFTIAMWLKFEEDIRDNTDVNMPGIIMYSGHFLVGGGVGVKMVFLSTEEVMFRVVDGYSNYTDITVPTQYISYSNWTNFGFVYTPDRNLTAFVNGIKVVNETIGSGDNSDSNFDNTLTLGTQFSALSSAHSFVISDVVYWDRYLRDFESYLLLGLTRREYELFQEADFYWTTDGYVRREQALISDLFNLPNNFLDIGRAGGVDTLMAPGRDAKGYAAYVLADLADLWLILGNFDDHCISDPTKCTNGISFSIWVQLPQNTDNATHFILSSGEQVHRGFSIYQRDMDKLGAAVTDGGRRWVVEVDYTPYVQLQDVNLNITDSESESYLDEDYLGPWINLAITWTEREGLAFYIDGRMRAMDPVGYRKFRLVDNEGYLVVGRRNDFLGDAVNMTFEECVIMEHTMQPFEVRDSLAKLDNLEYLDAKYSWDAPGLFSNIFDILNSKVYNDTYDFLGPTSGVYLIEDSAVQFTDDDASITLGDFRKDFVSDPSVNPKGMSFAFWAKLTFTMDGSPKFIFSSGAHISTGCRGIALYVQDDKMKLKINDGSRVWEASYNSTGIMPGVWTNIAFVWHKIEPLAFYVNGVERPPATLAVANMTSEDTKTMFVIGRRNNAMNGYYVFTMRNLVIWDRYLYPKHVHKMLGISDVEKYFLDQSDYYWSFDPETNLIQSLLSMSGGAMYAQDRHHHGRTVYTDGEDDWVSLAKFGNHCMTNPSICENGFVLAMWIKIKDLYRGDICLATTGADVEGERGMSISQTPDFLWVNVSDGVESWSVSISEELFNYEYWQYLSIRWRGNDGLAVGINGTQLASKIKGDRDSRDNVNYEDLILGRCSTGTDGFMEAYFDDIILITPKSQGSLPVIEKLYGDPVCHGYLSADNYFNLTSPMSGVTSVNTMNTTRGEEDGNTRGLSVAAMDTLGYVDIGDFSDRCLSNAYQCTDGVTLSVWVKIMDVSNLNNTELETNPEGVGYILSSGAQNNYSAGFAIFTDNITTTFEAHDGVSQWINHYNFTFDDDWTNVGMTWNWREGIVAYIDGIMQIPMVEKVAIVEIAETGNLTNATTASPPTTPVYNLTDCSNSTNSTGLNNTACNVTATTAAPPGPTKEPSRPECNSTRCDDSFTHLILGKRNDREDGYLKAEFADFAVWYKTMDSMDPDVPQRLKGEECHEVVVTTDHSALDGLSVWTGTIECDAIHKIDCTQDLDELFEVTVTENEINGALKDEVIVRLKNYSDVGTYLTVDEMEMMTVLVDKVVARELPAVMNVTEAEQDLSDLLEITSNLFDAPRRRRWISIHQNDGGATKLMKEMEVYAMQVADTMQTDVNGTKGPVESVIATDNIVLTVSRFEIEPKPNKGVTFPNYKDSRLSSINESWQQPTDSINLPKNFFDFASKSSGSATVIGFMYNTVSDFLPMDTEDENIKSKNEIKMASRILSLEVEPKLRMDLYNPIEIVLSHREPKSEDEEAVCSFWDFNAENTINGAWNTEGCEVHSSNETHTVCYCYHLTHFGIIVQPIDVVEPDPNDTYIQYITFGGTALSLIAIASLLCIYGCVKSLHTTRNIIHMNLCVAMLFAKLAYVMVFMAKLDPIACKSVAVIMQYFYTATFAWMLVEGIYLLIEMESTIGKYFRDRKRYLVIIGWGLPLMIAGISVSLHFESYGTDDWCWVTFTDGTVYMFVGPAIVIVLINFLILGFVMRNIDDVASRDKDHFESRRASFRATAILLPLLGISWVCALLNSLLTGNIYLRYIFTILNSLQGVFIFLFHGLGSQEIRMVMRQEDLEVEFSKVEKVIIRQKVLANRKEPPPPDRPSYVS